MEDLNSEVEKSASKALSAEEQAVVRKYAGKVGWPTILLTAALVAIHVSVWVYWKNGSLPMWAGFIINSLVAYCFYTVHHDATHKAISGRKKNWKFVENVCGNIAGVALLLEFDGYAQNHLRHHAHVNTAKDPDIAVMGEFKMLPRKWLFGTVFNVIGALPRGPRMVMAIMKKMGAPTPGAKSEREMSDARRMRRLMQAGLIVLAVSIPLGWFVPVFFLWWFASRVGIFILMVFFQWLPHIPFNRSDRFGATRINRFIGSTWLLLQQDHHLIHHLYPSIPWYRYRAAFRELRPILEANGAPIQGRGTTPHVPVQWKMTPASAGQ